MGRLLSLVLIAGLAYGGLYIYYGVIVEDAIEAQLERRGLTAVEVEQIDYGFMAPLSNEATISAELDYRGAEATVTVRLEGHPLFSDEIRIQLEGLQALRLRFGENE
ncbi:hypothetical protein F0A17_05745 [Billgrantia pellis]|uniref:DUF945 family protein n=1 Tax=Billgrantia pellis TaxID=2606936 RepID=A0A7V7G1V8_9GAMM|nr:hypothetical protein [Halomonas pellis]KAA0013844.1 hypothetical protein F0A17_05745 [Halomonas pellis]